MFEDQPWKLLVRDKLDACERVLEFTDGMDQAALLEEVRTYHTTLPNLALTGEAASRIPKFVRDSHPSVPWRSIVGAPRRRPPTGSLKDVGMHDVVDGQYESPDDVGEY